MKKLHSALLTGTIACGLAVSSVAPSEAAPPLPDHANAVAARASLEVRGDAAPPQLLTFDTARRTVRVFGSAPPGAVVSFVTGFGAPTTVEAGRNGSWIATLTDVPAHGEQSIVAVATLNGTEVARSAPLRFDLGRLADLQQFAPIAAKLDHADPATRSVQLSGTGEPGQIVRTTGDFASAATSWTTIDDAGTWRLTVSNVPLGDRSIQANANYATSVSPLIRFTLREDGPAPARLGIAHVSVDGSTVTVTGTGIPGTVLEALGNAPGFAGRTVTVGGDGAWSLEVDRVPAGSWYVQMRQRGGGYSNDVDFAVTALPAAAPQATTGGSGAPSGRTGSATSTERAAVTSEFSAAVDAIDSATLSVVFTGTAAPGTVISVSTATRRPIDTIAQSDGTWSLRLTGVLPGTHQALVTTDRGDSAFLSLRMPELTSR